METPGLKASQSPLEGPPLCAECVAIFKTIIMGKAALAFDGEGDGITDVLCVTGFGVLSRYLLVAPRPVLLFQRQDPKSRLDALADSNWAGCPRTRRSTSSCCLRHGGLTILLSSTT